MAIHEFVITTPSDPGELREQLFDAARTYDTMTVTVQLKPGTDELAARRSTEPRDITFRIEDIQPNPDDFLVIAQEVTPDETGATLYVTIRDGEGYVWGGVDQHPSPAATPLWAPPDGFVRSGGGRLGLVSFYGIFLYSRQ